MDLKIFEAIEPLGGEEREEEGEEEEYSPQVFPEHSSQEIHYQRSLYFGALPATDRPSLPLTRLAVDQFTSSGLDALGQKLGRLDMSRAADISRQACAGPNSLVLALLYLDRLRRRNPDYLTTVSSADLFLVSLMVASKFLHDDGEEDEVFNDEWASSGGMDTKELNRLEVKFLAAMDWRIFVDQAEFQATLQRLESDIAMREMCSRGSSSATYSDLTVLSSGEAASHLLTLLAQAAIKVTAVCLTTYAAGLLTLLGTAAALSRTPLGPAAVSSSVRTLAAACRGLEEQDGPAEELYTGLTSADLVTASLLVATLTSSPLTAEMREDLDMEEDGQELNRTRALWLSELSRGPDGGPQDGSYSRPPDRSSYSSLPGAEGDAYTYLYRDRPDPGTHSSLPDDLLQDEQLLSYLQRCPVMRWGAQVTAWPALQLGITAG